MPNYSEKKEKEKKKRMHQLLKNAVRSQILQTDGRTSLLFMRPINIFSRISAILRNIFSSPEAKLHLFASS